MINFFSIALCKIEDVAYGHLGDLGLRCLTTHSNGSNVSYSTLAGPFLNRFFLSTDMIRDNKSVHRN
jgi:hypothetical protein